MRTLVGRLQAKVAPRRVSTYRCKGMACRKTTKCASGYGSNPAGFYCGVCKHFRSGACAIVEGPIRSNDCCNLFDSATFRLRCRK